MHKLSVQAQTWAYGLLIIALVVVTYLPATRCSFIWDDDKHLTANPCVVGPLGLKEIWTSAHARIYPLVQTVFWMEYRLCGLNPMPYHVVNILFHAASALVLWRVLLRLKVPGARLGAALWALHPVQVESVAWITEMKNTQSGLFFLLAILFFCKSRPADHEDKPPGRTRIFYSLTLVFGAMAMTSKTSTVVLPMVLGLCAWRMEGRWTWWRNIRQLSPLLLMSVLAGIFSIWTQSLEGAGQNQVWALSGLQRVVVAGKALWFYLGKLIWPHPLVMIYPRWEISTTSALDWLPTIAAVVMTWMLWLKRDDWNGRGRALLLTWVYFVLTLLPVLGLVNHGFLAFSFVGDHFQYLASMGPLALAGAGISTSLAVIRLPYPWLKPAFISILFLALGILSWQQCAIYQNEEILWTATLPRNPDCWVAHNNLGVLVGQKGQTEASLMHLKKAVEINPGYADAQNNLGTVLKQNGNLEDALTHYQIALDINPNFAEAHGNLGLLLQQKGKMDEAMAHFQKALDINPHLAEQHFNLGNLFMNKSQMEEALLHFQKALDINPNYAEVMNNMAFVLATTVQASLRDGARSFALAQRANQLTGGRDLIVLGTLAAALAEAGDFSKAVETAEQAIQVAEAQSSSELAAVLKQHLKLYRSGQPLRIGQ